MTVNTTRLLPRWAPSLSDESEPFSHGQWTCRKPPTNAIAICHGQLPVLKGGQETLSQWLPPPAFEKTTANWMVWKVLSLNRTVYRTMAASSKSCYNHINEINQWISSSQMSGRQGGSQPRWWLTLGGGEGEKSTVLCPRICRTWQIWFTNLKAESRNQKAVTQPFRAHRGFSHHPAASPLKKTWLQESSQTAQILQLEAFNCVADI